MTKLMRNAHATHIDYGEFVGLIPDNPNFCPSNIDGIAERNGHVLLMEWKRKGEKVSDGQKRLLRGMADMPKVQVVIIRGDTDHGLNINTFWTVPPKGSCVRAGNGVNDFFNFYRRWYDYANRMID
jgi:hypothetical protein